MWVAVLVGLVIALRIALRLLRLLRGGIGRIFGVQFPGLTCIGGRFYGGVIILRSGGWSGIK